MKQRTPPQVPTNRPTSQAPKTPKEQAKARIAAAALALARGDLQLTRVQSEQLSRAAGALAKAGLISREEALSFATLLIRPIGG